MFEAVFLFKNDFFFKCSVGRNKVVDLLNVKFLSIEVTL